MMIYTIGHSTHDKEVLVSMLQENNIDLLVDIRSYPGSKKFPHFNKEVMPDWLEAAGVQYKHIPELGGRRRKLKDVEADNGGWQNISFKNYADYTSTDTFAEGLTELMRLAHVYRVAYMCSEHHPSRCHRTIVSDNLTALGVTVMHILPNGKGTKLTEHTLGGWGAKPCADHGHVTYPEEEKQLTLNL